MFGDILGHEGRRREYVVHLAPPRFAARIVACDQEEGRPEPQEPRTADRNNRGTEYIEVLVAGDCSHLDLLFSAAA